MKVTLEKPYPPRSTGKKSQNSHIWGHLQQIANYRGYNIHNLEDYLKKLAVGYGYPYRIKDDGSMEPYHFTEIDSRQAAIMIEVIHQYAAEQDIKLWEDDW